MSAAAWNPDGWTSRERLTAIVAQEINDAPAEELIKATVDDALREWAAKIRKVGGAKGWSTWAAEYMDPDAEFVDVGTPPIEEIEAAATEYRLTPAPPAYTPLIVRRDPAYDGTSWAVLHDPGDRSVRRAWTATGWEMAWSLSHIETYCWADAASALAQARRALAEDDSDNDGNVDGIGRTPESYSTQPPPVSLATPCAQCAHALNWHGKDGCSAGSAPARCGCRTFARRPAEEGEL
ncbi:hypothetical protein ACFUEN_29030 [Streptomyces griseorubiginosus]|uniref:hypothetical protein n=1 Tax=Streptomyces griseorubiginosus TaxID=67304 RepID=UPI00363FD396